MQTKEMYLPFLDKNNILASYNNMAAAILHWNPPTWLIDPRSKSSRLVKGTNNFKWPYRAKQAWKLIC